MQSVSLFTDLKLKIFSSIEKSLDFRSLIQLDFVSKPSMDLEWHQYYLFYCLNFALKAQIFIFT